MLASARRSLSCMINPVLWLRCRPPAPRHTCAKTRNILSLYLYQGNANICMVTLASRVACLEIVSRFTSESSAASCAYCNDDCRISFATSSSSRVYWQPSPPYPSRHVQEAQQAAAEASARHWVSFNDAEDDEEKYSHAPRVDVPQLLGHALAGVTHV